MNKYIAVSYQLFVQERGATKERLQEQRTDDQPLEFITGLNMILPPFEDRVSSLETGVSFDFQILPTELYGEYNPELIAEVPIGAFNGPDGKPNFNMLYEGNVIPMSDGEGANFLATVMKIEENQVTIDLNHPQSGTTLHITGKVEQSRPATEAEIQNTMSALEKSSCGCGGCGGCGGGSCGDGCNGGCNGGCGGCE